jgi:hypothetical protein
MNEKISNLINEKVLVKQSDSPGYWSIYDLDNRQAYVGKLKSFVLINPTFNIRRVSMIGLLKRGPKKQKFHNEVNHKSGFTIGSSHTSVETSSYAEFRGGRIFV